MKVKEASTNRHVLDSADLARCVHCGLCLDSCPTFRQTGLETESPRGRIQLISMIVEQQLEPKKNVLHHLDLCLGCRACEAVCPSGVPYGRILERARYRVLDKKDKDPKVALALLALRHVVANPPVLHWSFKALKLAKRAGLIDLFPGAFGLPEIIHEWAPPGLVLKPYTDSVKARVAFFLGCIMPYVYSDVHQASIELLRLAGCEVVICEQQRCCGALHAHVGDLKTSDALTEINERAFSQCDFDYLVVNSAGCGAHIREAYPHLGPKTRDLSELLVELDLPQCERAMDLTIVYHDPCHLRNVQKVYKEPRKLLHNIPGIKMFEVAHPETCCGSAGIYGFLEPKMSSMVTDEKLTELLENNPDIIVTANPGCQMQLTAGVRRLRRKTQIMHIAQFLAMAYGLGNSVNL